MWLWCRKNGYWYFFVKVSGGGGCHLAIFVSFLIQNQFLKLPVCVVIVISFHNSKNPHQNRIFLGFFGKNLKISQFSAKICKIHLFFFFDSDVIVMSKEWLLVLFVKVSGGGGCHLAIFVSFLIQNQFLKLPVCVVIVISFHNSKNPHQNRIFLGFFGKNLKISQFSAKICKSVFFFFLTLMWLWRRKNGYWYFFVSMEKNPLVPYF